MPAAPPPSRQRTGGPAIDRTIRGCGIRARALEMGGGQLRVIFPEVAGEPEDFDQIRKIILDIQGEEKKKLTVKDLLDKFEEASGEEFSNDSALLS